MAKTQNETVDSFGLGGLFVKHSMLLVRAIEQQLDDIDAETIKINGKHKVKCNRHLAFNASLYLSHVLTIEGGKSTDSKKYYVRMNAEMPVENGKKVVARTSLENSFEQNTGLTKKQQMPAKEVLVQLQLIEIDNHSFCGRHGVWPNRQNIDKILTAQAEIEGGFGFSEENQTDAQVVAVEVKEPNPVSNKSIKIGNKELPIDKNGVVLPAAGNDLDEHRYRLIAAYDDAEVKDVVNSIVKRGDIPQISSVIADLKKMNRVDSAKTGTYSSRSTERRMIEPSIKATNLVSNVREI